MARTGPVTNDGFEVVAERGELRLRGTLSQPATPALEAAAAAVLGAADGDLTLDLVDLDVTGAAVVPTLNSLAGQVADGQRLVLRVAEEDLDSFSGAELHPSILVQATSAIPRPAVPRPAPAARVEPSDGTARREGRGFVASYGAGRSCAVTGCTTQLSRYNERDVCATHAQPTR